MSENFQKPTRVWQRMLSNRRLDLVNPDPNDIEISDIALGLSRVSRWNGQTFGEHAFSVAQHSLLVESIFSSITLTKNREDSLVALLHDAAEYVIGDMISPFKSVVGGDYKLVEARLEQAIHLRFGLPATPSEKLKTLIKQADNIAAFFEATQLSGFSENEATAFFGTPPQFDIKTVNLEPLSAQNAQKEYINRFNLIKNTENTL
jgi:uncharacterized protein